MYYVQAHWAHLVGNSAVENVCIIIILMMDNAWVVLLLVLAQDTGGVPWKYVQY